MIIKQALKRIFSVVFFLYPLLAFLGVRYFDARIASLVLSLILIARLTFLRSYGQNPFGRVFDVIWWIVLANNIVNIYFKSELALKIYPALMSLGVFGIFVHSLIIKKPIIEKFARMHESHLSEERLKYIWKLTVLWSCWLFINTTLSIYTALFADFKHWAIYNNIVFYVVCGILFVGDFSFRKLVLNKQDAQKAKHV
jgi:uncharacterized membrane protein